MKKIFLISSFLIIIQFSHSQYITDRTIIYYQFNEDKSVLLHKHCPFFLRISTETNSYSIINSSWGVTLDHNADGTGSQDSVLIYQDTISIGYMSFSKDTISCIDSKSDQTMLIFKYLDKYRTKVINMGKFFKKDEILYLTTIIGEGWREVLTWKDKEISHQFIFDRNKGIINIDYKNGIPIDTIFKGLK
jgi:hypothetical protein